MDWGFGNPNKTAALVAMLMVAIWGLSYLRRWGFWPALVLFTGLGVCLVHTFSRGGLVALTAGMLPLIWLAKNYPWPKSRLLGLAVSLFVIGGSSIYFQAYQRYAKGIGEEDRSISNRLSVWERAPRMMLDSPNGWGPGNSGTAFMEWYQPLDRSEGYRTLVNSHLTWLVEFSWPLRILYLFAWGTVLTLCWPNRRMPWLAFCLGVWLAWTVAAIFSSVGESVWLWSLPALALGIVLAGRTGFKGWPPAWSWIFSLGLALAFFLAVILWPRENPNFVIRGSAKATMVGETNPGVWLVQNEKVFGKQPGRLLRTSMEEGAVSTGWGMAKGPEALPPGKLEKVITGGNLSDATLALLKSRLKDVGQLVLINPYFGPEALGVSDFDKLRLKVYFGCFSPSGHRQAWEAALGGSVTLLDGTADYCPQWPSLM